MSALLLLAASIAPPQLVEEIAQQIADRYVLVEEGPRIAERLLELSWNGVYDGIDAPSKLAERLGDDLRRISGDLHFAVQHDPALAARLRAAEAETAVKLPEIERTAEELERMRRANHGFRRVEILAGNVALVELTSFDDLELSRDVATSAMAFVSDADAVIFDVRANQGGSGNSVGFLVSHFVAAGTELMATFDREIGETTVARALEQVPGKRLTAVPLFVVTGPSTASAAEAFAFTLQQIGRATIVGEKTVGAAQGGGWVPVGDGFVVFIPNFRPFNPKTGESWQGTGVQPDLAAPVERAVAVAHGRAVDALKRSRAELSWLLPLLELDANGPARLDTSGLAGRYEGIEITEVDGELRFLGASGVLREMEPLSDGTFLVRDSSVPPTAQARVRFVRDASGSCSGLELLTEAGDVIPRSRL